MEREKKQVCRKNKFLLFTTSQVHKNLVLYPKSSLAKVSTTTPNVIIFSLL
jgi:hypothetical protein